MNWDGISGKGKAQICEVYQMIKKYSRISNYKLYETGWILFWAINALKYKYCEKIWTISNQRLRSEGFSSTV